jgi:hypothetical protein
MTKSPCEKHYEREDHEHAAHQSEAVEGYHEKIVGPIGKSNGKRGGYPVEGHPKSPRRGQSRRSTLTIGLRCPKVLTPFG